MRLLLLSNSTNHGQGYLEHADPWLSGFLGDRVRRVLFIPYAGVTVTPAAYAAKVRSVFTRLGFALDCIDDASDPQSAVENAEALAVGGGNTFRLLQLLYRHGLMETLRRRVESENVPFIGWSAGSNVAGPTIGTTNDMPIVEPPSFAALGFVPFQINPHYTDAHPTGHQGETRSDRLAEFVELNRDVAIAAMPEGTALQIDDHEIRLLGNKQLRVFRFGSEPVDMAQEANLSELLNQGAR